MDPWCSFLHRAQNDDHAGEFLPPIVSHNFWFKEHDEAVMLEAAMFGGIPEAPTYPLSFPSHGSSSHYPQVHSPPPELTEQRLLREQQVDN